jgi:hypothetical protein
MRQVKEVDTCHEAGEGGGCMSYEAGSAQVLDQHWSRGFRSRDATRGK